MRESRPKSANEESALRLLTSRTPAKRRLIKDYEKWYWFGWIKFLYSHVLLQMPTSCWVFVPDFKCKWKLHSCFISSKLFSYLECESRPPPGLSGFPGRSWLRSSVPEQSWTWLAAAGIETDPTPQGRKWCVVAMCHQSQCHCSPLSPAPHPHLLWPPTEPLTLAGHQIGASHTHAPLPS